MVFLIEKKAGRLIFLKIFVITIITETDNICPDNAVSSPHYMVTVEDKTYEVKPKTYSNTNFLNSGNGIADTDEYDYFEIIHDDDCLVPDRLTLYLTPETKERLQPKCEVVTVGKRG